MPDGGFKVQWFKSSRPGREIVVKSLQAVEKLGLQAVQKGPNARRARNRRAEAYLLIRWSEAIEAQRSRWAFFNSLFTYDIRWVRVGGVDGATLTDFDHRAMAACGWVFYSSQS